MFKRKQRANKHKQQGSEHMAGTHETTHHLNKYIFLIMFSIYFQDGRERDRE